MVPAHAVQAQASLHLDQHAVPAMLLCLLVLTVPLHQQLLPGCSWIMLWSLPCQVLGLGTGIGTVQHWDWHQLSIGLRNADPLH